MSALDNTADSALSMPLLAEQPARARGLRHDAGAIHTPGLRSERSASTPGQLFIQNLTRCRANWRSALLRAAQMRGRSSTRPKG